MPRRDDGTRGGRVPSGVRRVLSVFPRYSPSFGTLDHAFGLVGVKAFMPPQGLLVITAYLPDSWEVRFLDENVRELTEADLRWAEVVLLSGMHVQRDRIHTLVARAKAAGCLTVLGGPSVSASPEWYPDLDLLHIGELGDATDELIARLAASVSPPATQEVYTTLERLPLDRFPIPAYDQLNMRDYLSGSIQFSSGCPFRCEFCDIPELYGRNPRLKSPEQVVAELDAMLARGNPGSVYFVDDNFIGNPHATGPLLEALVAWQESRGFPLELACEASLNITKRPGLLELMRQARFTTVFCGIETPETTALERMGKTQNLRSPILESIDVLNSYGLEVVSGIILGLDTDTPQTYERVAEFIEASHIPMLTVNLLQALPRTPLWRRLAAEGRLLPDDGERGSNVAFLLPEEQVVNGWRSILQRAFAPEALYARYAYQLRRTYPNRRPVPATRARLDPALLARGFATLGRVIWRVGVTGDYRATFWRMAGPTLRSGRLDELLRVTIVAHHLICFAREALRGERERSFYSPVAPTARFGRGTPPAPDRPPPVAGEQTPTGLRSAGAGRWTLQRPG